MPVLKSVEVEVFIGNPSQVRGELRGKFSIAIASNIENKGQLISFLQEKKSEIQTSIDEKLKEIKLKQGEHYQLHFNAVDLNHRAYDMHKGKECNSRKELKDAVDDALLQKVAEKIDALNLQNVGGEIQSVASFKSENGRQEEDWVVY